MKQRQRFGKCALKGTNVLNCLVTKEHYMAGTWSNEPVRFHHHPLLQNIARHVPEVRRQHAIYCVDLYP